MRGDDAGGLKVENTAASTGIADAAKEHTVRDHTLFMVVFSGSG